MITANGPVFPGRRDATAKSPSFLAREVTWSCHLPPGVCDPGFCPMSLCPGHAATSPPDTTSGKGLGSHWHLSLSPSSFLHLPAPPRHPQGPSFSPSYPLQIKPEPSASAASLFHQSTIDSNTFIALALWQPLLYVLDMYSPPHPVTTHGRGGGSLDAAWAGGPTASAFSTCLLSLGLTRSAPLPFPAAGPTGPGD